MSHIDPESHLGQRVIYKGEWCAIANIHKDVSDLHPAGKIWLISLEQKDALPFLLGEGEEFVIPKEGWEYDPFSDGKS